MVFVLNRQPLERTVFLDDVYRTPVGEAGHRKTGYAGQRSSVIKRGGQCCSDLCQEALRLLPSFTFGYVVSDIAQDFPTVAEDGTNADLDVHQRAILAAKFPLAHGPLLLFQDEPDVAIYALPVGSDDVVECHASELFLRIAKRLLKRGVGLHDESRLGIHEEDVLRSLLDYGTVEPLAFLERLLGPLALRDVTGDCGGSNDLPG